VKRIVRVLVGGYKEGNKLGFGYLLKLLAEKYGKGRLIVRDEESYIEPVVRILRHKKGVSYKKFKKDVVIVLSEKVRKEERKKWDEYWNLNSMKVKDIELLIGVKVNDEKVRKQISKLRVRLDEKIKLMLNWWWSGRLVVEKKVQGYWFELLDQIEKDLSEEELKVLNYYIRSSMLSVLSKVSEISNEVLVSRYLIEKIIKNA